MTAADTFAIWTSLAKGGSINSILNRGVSWSWTAKPERQQNGALRGRVYAHPVGEQMRDIGAFKINADGSIAAAPKEFADVLQENGYMQSHGLTPLAARAQISATAFSTDDIEVE